MQKPYPEEYAQTLTLRDGTQMVVRPIRPEDRQIEREFVHGLSAESKYFRFMSPLGELSDVALNRFTQIDYDREMALIAVVRENGQETEIGVARYVVFSDGVRCEFAVAVADAWQRHGVASTLVRKLAEIARARGLRTMEGLVLASNHKMMCLINKLGLRVEPEPGDASMKRVTMDLRALPAPPAADAPRTSQ